MPGKTKCSASRKAQYQSYSIEGRRDRNKEKKMKRHAKSHPNDQQSLKRGKTVPIPQKVYFSNYTYSENYVQNILHKGVR